MYLRFEENLNCGFTDDRVFQERSEPRAVAEVRRRRGGHDLWCPIVGLDGTGTASAAMACKVEDSGEGMCYLVYGGVWGVRLKEPACRDAWSLDDAHQWGEPFLLLGASGEDLRFVL